MACAFESAPELADDLAAPAALASPVRPESPESPDSASPCGVLADNNDGNLSDKQIEYAKTIYASGGDLLSLIN